MQVTGLGAMLLLVAWFFVHYRKVLQDYFEAMGGYPVRPRLAEVLFVVFAVPIGVFGAVLVVFGLLGIEMSGI